MDDRFTLTITLGNDAMQSPVDVADALRTAADRVEAGTAYAPIRDANGNTVGSFAFESAD